MEEVRPQSTGFQDIVQRQLTELLHGQERLEKMIVIASNRYTGSIDASPRNGIPTTPRLGTVQLCRVASARGDASISPRLAFADDSNGNNDVGNKCEPSARSVNISETDQFKSSPALYRESHFEKLEQIGTSRLDEEMISKQVEATFREAQSKKERSKDRLKTTIKDTQDFMIQEVQKQVKLQQYHSYLIRIIRGNSKRSEIAFDAFIQFAIFVNTIFIGLSVDLKHDNQLSTWIIADMAFAAIFASELLMKLYLHGCWVYFMGSDKYSNIFDFIIIAVDCFQLVGTINEIGSDDSSVRSASVLRVARMIRIVRIIRVMKFQGMRAFVDMLQGVLDGAATLFWAILMFLLMVYCGGILCKICFGTASNDLEKQKTLYPLFDSVLRSMLTVFRCSFGDCSTIGGTPIPEFILEEYGWEYSLGYCLFLFFITVGLFNIISAIFVDSTMNASAAVQSASKNDRLKSTKLWATSITAILTELLQYKGATDSNTLSNVVEDLTPDAMLENFESLVAIEFTRQQVEDVVHTNRKVQKALDHLDIEPADHNRLSDILDPDHSGTIDALELVEGLGRLRGDPRRSDVVTCDLMIRSLQTKTDEVLAEVLHVKRKVALIERNAMEATLSREPTRRHSSQGHGDIPHGQYTGSSI